MLRGFGLAAAVTFAGCVSALADDVFTDDVIVMEDLLCVGFLCVNGEAKIPSRSGIKLKGGDIAVRFDDTSIGVGFTRGDWQISINEAVQFGSNVFRIDDLTGGTTPFSIAGNAREDALFVASSGNVGFGTQLPLQNLHVFSSISPGLRLEKGNGGGTPPRIWEMAQGVSGLEFLDLTAGTFPLELRNGAPSRTLVLDTDGEIGMGTNAPAGKLHTRGNGVQLVYFESGDGGPVQVRFRTNSENRRFLAVNNANEVQSQIIFLDDRINFTGATDSGANLWLSIGPDGIVSQGPTCGSPCDLTFDPEHFSVPPIAERAAFMWDNMHLPAIGPTSPDQPINLTEKTGGIIHELEVAHIYIEQLHARLAAQEDALKRYDARDEALLALIEELRADMAELQTNP